MKTKALHTFKRIALAVLLNFAFTQFVHALTGPGPAWLFVRKITLSPVTPAANYQVKVTLVAGQYTNMNASGNDLRFYDINNNACSYWIETWNNASTSTIWVKAPVSGSSALYMYYGNGAIGAASNGPATFDFFDDGSTLTGWTNVSATVDNTRGLPLPSLKAVANQYAYRNIGLTANTILEYSDYVISGTADLNNLYFLANSTGAGQMFRLDTRGTTNYSGFASTTTWTTWAAPTTVVSAITANTFHSVRIVIKATSADGFIDGTAFGSYTFANNGGYIAVHGDGATVTGGNFDNIRVRQYTASEPVSTVGNAFSNNLAATISAQTNVLCFGLSTGAATVTATGASSPYTYLWSNAQTGLTITGLPAATYSVTVTDNIGLTASASATITQPGSAVGGSISSQTNVLCNGQSTGSVTVAGSGGVGPYTYALGAGSYSSTATFGGLSATNYTVHIKDFNGCIYDQGVSITQPATAVGGSITSQTNVLCNGQSTGSVTVAGSGGVGPYTYALDAGTYSSTATFGSLAATSYTVHVKDFNGCIYDQAVTITQLPAVTAAVNGQTNPTCFGGNNGTITILAGGGTVPYQFSVDNGVSWLPGIGNNTSFPYPNLSAGVAYKIRVKDTNGCTSKSVQ